MLRLCAAICCITGFILSVCDGSMQTLIGKTGESVTLPCRYDYTADGLATMCWGRAEVPLSKCSNTIVSTDGEKVTFRKSSRYRLRKRVEKGDVSLTIVNLTENDSGVYGCRVEIPGWFNDLKLNFNLSIVTGAPESNTPLIITELPVLPFDAQQVALESTIPLIITERPVFPSDTQQGAPESNTPLIITELPVFSSDTQQGEWTTPSADMDNSDVLVLVTVQAQEISQKFNGNAIRIGVVIFIPGLIIILILELKSRQEKESKRAQLDCHAPAVQVRN